MDLRTLLVLITLLLQLGRSAKRPTASRNHPVYFRMRYAAPCKDYPSDVSSLENITIRHEGINAFVSANLTLHRDVQLIHKAIITIRRCNDPAENQNCEPFHTLRFGTETCFLMQQKNMPWSLTAQAFHPKFDCPILKGVHQVVNATLDLASIHRAFTGIQWYRYFWRVRVEAYDYKMFACFNFGAQILHGKNY